MRKVLHYKSKECLHRKPYFHSPLRVLLTYMYILFDPRFAEHEESAKEQGNNKQKNKHKDAS